MWENKTSANTGSRDQGVDGPMGAEGQDRGGGVKERADKAAVAVTAADGTGHTSATTGTGHTSATTTGTGHTSATTTGTGHTSATTAGTGPTSATTTGTGPTSATTADTGPTSATTAGVAHMPQVSTPPLGGRRRINIPSCFFIYTSLSLSLSLYIYMYIYGLYLL